MDPLIKRKQLDVSTSSGQRFRVGNIKYKQNWPHRLEDHQRTGADFDLSTELTRPAMRRGCKARARHLCVNEHRIEGRVKPEFSYKLH